MEEINKNGFVKFHLPCPLCSSSDAVSVNADNSAYCFSCQQYIREYDMEITEGTTNGANEYQVKDYLKESNYAEIIDRNIKEDSCKRYGVSVKMDSMGTITHHYYPYLVFKVILKTLDCLVSICLKEINTLSLLKVS